MVDLERAVGGDVQGGVAGGWRGGGVNNLRNLLTDLALSTDARADSLTV